jgi:hypothetical protein
MNKFSVAALLAAAFVPGVQAQTMPIKTAIPFFQPTIACTTQEDAVALILIEDAEGEEQAQARMNTLSLENKCTKASIAGAYFEQVYTLSGTKYGQRGDFLVMKGKVQVVDGILMDPPVEQFIILFGVRRAPAPLSKL